MDAYPEDYTVHNLPFFLVSGLEDKIEDVTGEDKANTALREGGFRIRIDAPCIQTTIAQPLLQALREHDATNAPWSAKYAALVENQYACRIRSVGRSYTLPPRKASPPPYSPQNPVGLANTSSSMTLHSTLSPLSSSSPLYADGIMSPLWVAKHRSYLPSVFIVFFSLVSDSTISTLEDNKIKSEITNIRSVFASVTYKTKLIFVLIGGGAIDTFEAEDRANNIRRATSTDSKSLSYLPGTTPSDALPDYATSLISNVHQASLEYYRDLSKHARRKRNRSTTPQPTIQSPSLTMPILNLQGWNVRYEFKLGVFAEFRQEMEAALRNYETAYDILTGPEVFGSTPSWSPRFNQNRLLADVIALRIIRACLWMGQTTNSVRFWLAHRDGMRDIANRRGAGTDNYEQESWQVVWSRSMADLIQRSQVLPASSSSSPDAHMKSILVHSEKTLTTTDRFMPWESLHHQGYWLNIAHLHTRKRREHARAIPEADRLPPDRARTSSIANKAHPYERYMALEPYQEHPMRDQAGPDYTREILQDLDKAIEQFFTHDQLRMAFVLQLRKAQELMRASSWNDAATLLVSLWQDARLRRTGWWLLASDVGMALWRCTVQTGNRELLHSLCWEASNPQFSAIAMDYSERDRILSNSSGEVSRLTMASDSIACQIIPQFAFAVSEGYVGKPIRAQLKIRCFGQWSNAHARLLLVKIIFEGGIRPICLLHDDQQSSSSENENTQIVEVGTLAASSDATNRPRRRSTSDLETLEATTDLKPKPDCTRVYQIEFVPREAGEASVASITLQLGDEGYEIVSTTLREDVASGEWWELQGGRPVSRRHGKMRDVASVVILPRPPRIETQFRFANETHYINDDIELTVQVTNEENEAIHGHIQVKLISASKSAISLEWVRRDGMSLSTKSDEDELTQNLPQIELHNIAAGQSKSYPILITRIEEAISHALEVVTTYTLASAMKTSLTKLTTIDLPIIRPFEANFNFHPRRHPDHWPQFFAASSAPRQKSDATGIKQQYLVTAATQSFAADDIRVESAILVAKKLMGHVTCLTAPGVAQIDANQALNTQGDTTIILESHKTLRFNFDVTIQKFVLGDGQPSAIDFELEIRWRRAKSERSNTSILQVPRFLAPVSEPRVLLRLLREASRSDVVVLEYTIENATMHFLTFNLAMESSDDYAFSGPKSKAVSLVPVSRFDLRYHIMPIGIKEWTRVSLQVVDAYFGQTLKIQPASDGVRVDKQGHVLVKFGH